MKTITRNEYIYLNSVKNGRSMSDVTLQITDEEYEDLIQYRIGQGGHEIEPTPEPEPEPGGEEPQDPTPYEPEPIDPNHDYSQDYLTFEALEDDCYFNIIADNEYGKGYAGFTYSIDNGETWIRLNKNESTISINTGETMLWSGDAHLCYCETSFNSSKNFIIYGNVMSLLYGHYFKTYNQLETGDKLEGLFNSCNKLISAEHLYIPNKNLQEQCYEFMFGGCTSLIYAPKISATDDLAERCYQGMFAGCSQLKYIQELSFNKLGPSSCDCMFVNCTSLENITLIINDNLEYRTACARMFDSCTSLNNFTLITQTNISKKCGETVFKYFLYNVNENGIFKKIQSIEIPFIPSGWTVHELDPETLEVVNEYIAE